jgi:hypothetical protein
MGIDNKQNQNNTPTGANPEALRASENQIMHPTEVIDRLNELPRVDGGRVIDQITSVDEAVTPEAAEDFIQVLRELEGETASETFMQNLSQLESYYARMSIASGTERQAAANADLDFLFSELRGQVAVAYPHVETFSTVPAESISARVNDGLDGAINLTSRGLRRLNQAHPAVQAGVVIGVIALIYKAATNLTIRNRIGSLLKFGAIAGVGAYLSNEISEEFTGRGLLENLGRLGGSGLNWGRNEKYANFFGVDYGDDIQEDRVDLLVETFRNDSNSYSQRPFSEIVNAAGSQAGRIPDSYFAGVDFNSVANDENTGLILAEGINMFKGKFGPSSDLYESNPEIKECWDELMAGTTSWREGVVRLLILTPQEIRDELGFIATARQTVSNATSGICSFTSDAFNVSIDALADRFNPYKDKIRDAYNNFMLEDDNGMLNNWLAKTITSEAELANFEGSVGSFAYRALNSSDPANLYTEPSQITYGAYKVPLSQEEFSNSTHRMNLVTEYSARFLDNIKSEYGAGYDNNLSGRLDILYGAELRQAGNGGQYYLSFSYTPENTPEDVNPILSTRAFNAVDRLDYTDFVMNRYEELEAMEHFQVDNEVKLRTVLRFIRNNRLPAGTSARQFVETGQIYSEDIRAAVMERLNQQLDRPRIEYTARMRAFNENVAAGDRNKLNALNALLYTLARNDSAYNSSHPGGFRDAYGTPNFERTYINYVNANKATL